ncbi:MAG: lysylphosphatidylglycerol synthase transmembrane domain-containing protein [Candidatus Latescibacterota bacterium]
MKRKLLIGSAVSAAFLYLALRGIQWSEFASVLERTRYVQLALAVFFTMLGHYLRAFRWRFMLSPIKQVPMSSAFSATSIGFMTSNLLPARIGEVVRAFAIGKSESISKSAAFATIVYERMVDVFVILICLWWVLLKISGPPWLRNGGFVILAANVAFLILLFVLERYRGQAGSLVQRIAAKLPSRLRDMVIGSSDRFFDGLQVVSQGRTLLPIAVVSLAVWYAALLGFYFCFSALQLELPQVAAATLVVIVAFGSMIPSAPAYLGTMQYACVVGLAIFNIEKSEALAYSLLYHATQFFPITIVGLYYMWRSHIRLSEVTKNR